MSANLDGQKRVGDRYPAPSERVISFPDCRGKRKGKKKTGKTRESDRIEWNRRPGDEKADWDGFGLPGCWSTTDEHCGTRFMMKCREGCGGRKVIFRSCDRITCPVCWKEAINRMTKRIVHGKVMPFSAHEENQGRKPMPSHLVVSPPPQIEKKPLKRIRKECVKVAKWAGMRAGVSIVHPWRIQNGQWVPGMHVHFIQFGWINFERVSRLATQYGWILKNIRVMENTADIFGTVKYLLSHCATKPGTPAYQYYGKLVHFPSVSVDPGDISCPACEAQMMPDAEYAWDVVCPRGPPSPGDYFETGTGLVPMALMDLSRADIKV